MSDVPIASLMEVDRLLAAGEFDDAVDLADVLVTRGRSAEALRALARALYERSTATYDEEEHEMALDTLREAADRAPDDRSHADILADLATMLTGSVFFTEAKEQEAARRYMEAYTLDPTNMRVLIGLAILRADPEINASRARAIGWVEQAIAQGAAEWWHWSELGKLYEEEGEQQRAIAAYEQMLALFPFGTGHPLEFVMRQQRKHLQALRAGRLELWDLEVRHDPPR